MGLGRPFFFKITRNLNPKLNVDLERSALWRIP